MSILCPRDRSERRVPALLRRLMLRQRRRGETSPETLQLSVITASDFVLRVAVD